MSAGHEALEMYPRMPANHLAKLLDGLLREAAGSFERQRLRAETELKNYFGVASFERIQIGLVDVRGIDIALFRTGSRATNERRGHVFLAYNCQIDIGGNMRGGG